jgi:hypothetical protein
MRSSSRMIEGEGLILAYFFGRTSQCRVKIAIRAAGDPIIRRGRDSAGGNLAITLINRLCAAGEPSPVCAWLISPWTDLTSTTLDTKDAVDPIIHKG